VKLSLDSLAGQATASCRLPRSLVAQAIRLPSPAFRAADAASFARLGAGESPAPQHALGTL
jgi:hypothetical protein